MRINHVLRERDEGPANNQAVTFAMGIIMQLLRKLLGWDTPAQRAVPRRRWSVKPTLEAFEDRLVPSSSGVLTSITDGRGVTTAFTIGHNKQIFAASGSGWNQLSSDPYGFQQVSAGLDGYLPVCYAIESSTGNLVEFYPVYDRWYSLNLGGQCLQISGTTGNECYAIGTDHQVYLNDTSGAWRWVTFAGGVATQISAGVDQFGADKVYVVMSGGYCFEVNHDSSYQWLPFRASQISSPDDWAMRSGTDLFYISYSDKSLHYFDGSTDTGLGGAWTQISAFDGPNGDPRCYALSVRTFNGQLYSYMEVRDSIGTRWFPSDANLQMTQISAASGGFVFGVTTYQNQIWINNQYYDNWQWTGGESTNPN
jgi:hypothetical protein